MALLSIFWNRDERRLRAFWRLLVQALLVLVLLIPMQAVVGFAAYGMIVQEEGITPEQLTEPGVTEGPLSPQAVQQFISDSAFLVLLASLAAAVAVIIAVWAAGRFLDRRPFADFGFHLNAAWWVDLGFGLFLGAFLMALIFLVELALGWVTVTGTFVTRTEGTSFAAAILLPLLTFLAVGVYEELISRGYQLQNAAEGLGRFGPHVAVLVAGVLSAAVFGVLHAANPNASFVSTFNIFVAGFLLLGMGRLLTGELAMPIGVHITWNFFQGNVFGFPVSGADFRSATVIGVEQAGPAVWTGGAFGPEAGLLGLAAIFLGALLTIGWVRWRTGRVVLATDLADPPAGAGVTTQPESSPTD